MDNADNLKRFVGQYGEKAAVKHLKKNGYKIVARNVREGHSEIDVIATKGDTLVFVEVKTRSYEEGKEYYTRPADAVNISKKSYLIRGADRFCSENGVKFAALCKRFDIIEVYLFRKRRKFKVSEIKHFENAILK